MNEYEILGGLHKIIDDDTNLKMKEWLDSHNVNNYLLYPLAAVELGAIKEAPENNENLLRRCVASFVYAKAKENEKSIFIKKFNTPGFKKYLKAYESELIPLYQNFRFSREINDINPFSSCLFAFIQIPLLFGFLEAINRVPVIFEENLFGLILGTTPFKAITSGHIEYAIIVILIGATTFISQKLNTTAPTPQTNDINPNTMMNFMLVMIVIMSLNFSVALSLYWIASTLFTIVQNLIVIKTSKKKEVK